VTLRTHEAVRLEDCQGDFSFLDAHILFFIEMRILNMCFCATQNCNKPSNQAFGFVTSFFGIKGAFFVFFSKTPKRICAHFLLGFKRKHLLITTCIEKHCIRPLKKM